MSDQLGLFDKGPEDLLAIVSYAEFRQALLESGCARCALSETRHNIVVDRGNPEAGILAVGEGPGAEEDATGLAFVGRGGRLFDRLMAEGGFDTNHDLLIANVVKCRPPENRVPKAPEVAACLPFLRRQIRLAKPKIIVLLGATALRHLLPGRGREAMQDVVGRPFEDAAWPGVRFLVFYHPAYLLRDPRKQADARAHIAKLRDILGEP
jgi:DNA polymerase